MSVNDVARDPEGLSAALQKHELLKIVIKGCSEKDVLGQMKQVHQQHHKVLFLMVVEIG